MNTSTTGRSKPAHKRSRPDEHAKLKIDNRHFWENNRSASREMKQKMTLFLNKIAQESWFFDMAEIPYGRSRPSVFLPKSIVPLRFKKNIVLQFHNFFVNHLQKLNFLEWWTFAIFLQYIIFNKARFACYEWWLIYGGEVRILKGYPIHDPPPPTTKYSFYRIIWKK